MCDYLSSYWIINVTIDEQKRNICIYVGKPSYIVQEKLFCHEIIVLCGKEKKPHYKTFLFFYIY